MMIYFLIFGLAIVVLAAIWSVHTLHEKHLCAKMMEEGHLAQINRQLILFMRFAVKELAKESNVSQAANGHFATRHDIHVLYAIAKMANRGDNYVHSIEIASPTHTPWTHKPLAGVTMFVMAKLGVHRLEHEEKMRVNAGHHTCHQIELVLNDENHDKLIHSLADQSRSEEQ